MIAAGSDTNIAIQVAGKGTGLTKQSVTRQDNTTDATTHDNVILTGQGTMTPNGVAVDTDTVTFGKTFSAAPIITIAYADTDVGGSTAWGDNINTVAKVYALLRSPTTTGFTAVLRSGDASNFGNGTRTFFYSWIAIGRLA